MIRARRPGRGGGATHALPRPTLSTAGVPCGLDGDERTPLVLTPSSSIAPAAWFSRSFTTVGSSGYWRFIIKSLPPGGLLEGIDFTDDNITLSSASGVWGGLTFRNCLFHMPTGRPTDVSTANPYGKPPSNLVSGFAIDGITFEDCTFNGNTYDPFQPISNPYNAAGSTNIRFDRCYVYGVANGFVAADMDGYAAVNCKVDGLVAGRGGAATKNLAGTPGAGGSLAAGDYYFNIAAITNHTSAGDQQTPRHPLGEVEATVGASGSVALTWTQFAPNGGFTVTGYRIYVGRAPGVYDGFFPVSGATTVAATYTGQALTTTADLGEYVGSTSHPDCVQIQATYARNILFQGNDFFARTPEGYSNSGGIQIGSMQAPKDVTNLKYLYNWVDGSANHFSGGADITYSGPFWFIGNRLGGALAFGVKNSTPVTGFQAILDTPDATMDGRWEGNVWRESGLTENGTTMVRDQVIP